MERRTFLVLGLAAVGTAGCTGESPEPGPPRTPASPTAQADPDARLRHEVAASETALIASYRSAILASPGLASDLEPFRTHHEEHLARIAPGFAVDPATPAPVSPGSRPPVASPPDAPPAETLAGLAAAESLARDQRGTACDGAQDPALARDLCLIAASEAQHAAALDRLAARESGS